MKTAELTKSERAKMEAMWASPVQQRVGASNPLVAAIRSAMIRTNWRVSVDYRDGKATVGLLAYDIRAGKPVGFATHRRLAVFQKGETDKIIDFLNALEAPAA